MLALVYLIAALVLPVGTGVCWVAWGWPVATPGCWSARLGYGYFVGIALTAGLLLLLEAVFGTWSYWGTLGLLALLGVLGAWLNRRYLWPASGAKPSRVSLAAWFRSLSLPLRLLVVALVVLLVWRLTGYLLEVIWRPITTWDNFYVWGYRAKLFFSAGGWVSPVPDQAWLDAAGALYHEPIRHPPLISLIQLWPALALGRWDESLTLLPWWFAGIAMLAAFYGHLRREHVPATGSLVAVFLVASLPIVNAQIALAGYADLWLAAFTGLAALSLFVARQSGSYWHAAMVVVMAALVIVSKQAGFLLAMALAAGAIAAWLPRWWLAGLVAVVPVTLALWIVTIGIDLYVPMLWPLVITPDTIEIPRGGAIHYRPVLYAFVQRLLFDGTWHLFFWAAPLFLVVSLPWYWRNAAARGVFVYLLSYLVVVALVFSFTEQAQYVVDATGINRYLMPVILPIVFLAAVGLKRWRQAPDASYTAESAA